MNHKAKKFKLLKVFKERNWIRKNKPNLDKIFQLLRKGNKKKLEVLQLRLQKIKRNQRIKKSKDRAEEDTVDNGLDEAKEEMEVGSMETERITRNQATNQRMKKHQKFENNLHLKLVKKNKSLKQDNLEEKKSDNWSKMAS